MIYIYIYIQINLHMIHDTYIDIYVCICIYIYIYASELFAQISDTQAGRCREGDPVSQACRWVRGLQGVHTGFTPHIGYIDISISIWGYLYRISMGFIS